MIYQPESRRPIANLFRDTASWSVRWCVRHRIHPNSISYLSGAAAALAGIFFWQASSWPWLLIPAVAFCYLRLWFNMLDGMVALAGGTASAIGEMANDLPDRFSDVVIFVGVAHGGLCHQLTGYWTALLALLVAYVGVLGQAAGGQREFSGLMSKPWRMVALHLGSWATLAMLWWADGRIVYGGLTVLDWTFLLIIAGCIQSIWIRLVRIVRALEVRQRLQHDEEQVRT